MISNCDLQEAEMVQYVRNWYDACNERGLSVIERIFNLVQMHNYLMSFYDPEYFPMNTSHVANLLSTTFQSILQNISMKIHLYGFSQFKTYNHRSVSTLTVESIFAYLSTLASSTNRIPLAVNIPKHISKMTMLNEAKENPEKSV